MPILLDRTYDDALDALVDRLPRTRPAGSRVEIWCFDDRPARAAAADALRAAGFEATVRSAFKPLVHAVLEELPVAGATAVRVRLPRHPDAPPDRFRLEAHPLSGLVPPDALRLEEGDPGLHHQVEITDADGAVRSFVVFAPNVVRFDALGERALCPCGWLRVTPPGAARPSEDGPFATGIEAAFADLLALGRDHPLPPRPPLFKVLEVRIDMPATDVPLGVGHEAIRLREAVHEDVYFSLRELLHRRIGADPADRTPRIGQIVPDIRPGAGPLRMRVAVRARVSGPFPAGPEGPLETADRPLHPDRIARELAALGGTRSEGRSGLNRPIPWTHLPGPGPGLVISGGQHANETTGVVGALRAAARLAADGIGNLAVIPLENPDGYALHGRLRRVDPDHMHHAARYTALGDDLEYRTDPPLAETAVRRAAYAATGVRLHVNLHGYPAHEWTRPFTGYVPRGFGAWMLPKGVFLILRHHPGLEAGADLMVEAVARRLAAVPGLADLNAAQLARHRVHAGEPEAPIRHGIVCDVRADDRSPAPFTLITEVPDETVGGADFVLLQTVQTEAVLAAAEVLYA